MRLCAAGSTHPHHDAEASRTSAPCRDRCPRVDALLVALVLTALILTAPGSAFAGTVALAWDPSPDAVAGYRLYYGTAPGAYSGAIDVGKQTSGTVPGLTDGVRYYFVVKAYSSSGVLSAASNEVSGVVGPIVSFTDDPLLPGVHTIKAVHLTELRSRIAALRSSRGLPAFAWASLAPGTLIRASHIMEMRTALNAVFVARGQASPVYVDGPTLIEGTSIKALHITQLRSAVLALEQP